MRYHYPAFCQLKWDYYIVVQSSQVGTSRRCRGSAEKARTLAGLKSAVGSEHISSYILFVIYLSSYVQGSHQILIRAMTFIIYRAHRCSRGRGDVQIVYRQLARARCNGIQLSTIFCLRFRNGRFDAVLRSQVSSGRIVGMAYRLLRLINQKSKALPVWL